MYGDAVKDSAGSVVVSPPVAADCVMVTEVVSVTSDKAVGETPLIQSVEPAESTVYT